eukprot:1682464-Pleurochrysis_carterae.AAC.3
MYMRIYPARHKEHARNNSAFRSHRKNQQARALGPPCAAQARMVANRLKCIHKLRLAGTSTLSRTAGPDCPRAFSTFRKHGQTSRETANGNEAAKPTATACVRHCMQRRRRCAQPCAQRGAQPCVVRAESHAADACGLC